jgi:hypothetical protein
MMTSADGALSLMRQHGLLLLSDARLPSLVALLSGGPIRGSWWGSPAGGRIYAALQVLDDHPDVASTKLVSGKSTFVHRQLWPVLVAVGSAREPWQLEGLSEPARVLLDLVTRDDEVRTDAVAWIVDPKRGKSGDAARELERRLLVYADEVHTESGAHAKVLRTWQSWAQHVGLAAPGMSPTEARRRLDEVVDHLNEEFAGDGRTPWTSVPGRLSRRARQ